ncbi:MAG: hypothetical protein HKN34_10765 [Gammaproteobacteria bacterium]|nr:hypothetical protein [Gammaproteobacteria bacterium]
MIDGKEEFFEYSLRLSKQHQQSYLSRPLAEERQMQFEGLASQSMQRQQELESNDQVPFEQFMQNYFDQR